MYKLIHAFDRQVLAIINAWPKWLYTPMVAITNVGQPLTVILFAFGLMVWAWYYDRLSLRNALAVVFTTIIAATILKLVLRRARPINEYVKKMFFHTYSFPSGHAAAATVGFGFFAYLVAVTLSAPWNIVIAASVMIFSLLVGISRIYLGAHYPTDVAGGILLGIIGLASAILTLG